MKPNLKPLPCPHCGSKKVETTETYRSNIHLCNDFTIHCTKCKAIMLSKIGHEDAIKKWNTRHDEMTLKKVLLLIPELAIKILALAVLAAGVYCIFA